MADAIGVYTSSSLIYSGAGVVQGLVLSATGATGVTVTLYDNTAGSGTKIFEASLAVSSPIVIFFPDLLAPRFATGLYISVGLTVSATVWSRQI
jgi:hypothetical protein